MPASSLHSRIAKHDLDRVLAPPYGSYEQMTGVHFGNRCVETGALFRYLRDYNRAATALVVRDNSLNLIDEFLSRDHD